jgi:hypothetical protein
MRWRQWWGRGRGTWRVYEGPDRGAGGSGGGTGTGCMEPTKVQRAVIPIQAVIARFWNKTLLAGLGASGGVGFGKAVGIYGSASAQIAVSPNGNAAYVLTFAAPKAVTAVGTYPYVTLSGPKGIGFLAGSQLGFSNATDPSQLEGRGVDASASLAAGLGIGGDVSLGSDGIYQANVTIGGGAGGRGGAGAITNTTVVPICRTW